MNICHINLARGFSGGESQTLLLVKEQIRLGYSLTIVAKKGSPFAKAASELQCTVIETPHYLTQHSKKITNAIDVMHVHEGQAIYWAFIQKLMHGVPYIVTRRIDNPFKNKWLSNLAYQHACVICGVSNAIKNIVNRQFPSKTCATVPDSPVSYPANVQQAEEIRHRFADKYLAIQAAKLYQHKGFDLTIQAARVLQETHPEIHFCLLGDGPEEANLKQQARGLSNLSFMGRQSNMGDWFSAASLLVHPSHSEGLGSVILEACKAGLPVIGTRAGGIPDAIEHEVNGLLIDKGNAVQLSEAIVRVKSDSELTKRIQQQAPAFIAQFDIAHIAKRYGLIYQDCRKDQT